MHQPSPGVERAVSLAEKFGKDLGLPQLSLVDIVRALLTEDEGRPALLVEKLGLNLEEFRHKLASSLERFPHLSPPIEHLYDVARNWSILHRADPEFMTDAFLLTVLKIDSGFMNAIAEIGLDARQIEKLLVTEQSSTAEVEIDGGAFALPSPTDEFDAARIIDVNFNRARESLRVLDDFARFVLEDRHLCEMVKTLRHELVTLAEQVPQQFLLSARETLQDVGTTVSAPGEYERQSPSDVALVNLKRLQESLRSLEEYGKLFGSTLGREFEAIRYRLYTLEKAMFASSSNREKLELARLYVLLTGTQSASSLDWIIAEASRGGAGIFQLREKALPDRELLERARQVRGWTRQARVLFIVNDRPDIARLCDADGVHLGQDDLSVRDARRILGAEAIIGVSTHTIEQVRQAVLDGADYLGIGPTFPSETKAFDHFPGLEFIRAATAETSRPAFALGGITPSNIVQVVGAGANRVAVSSAISKAEHPDQIADILSSALSK